MKLLKVLAPVVLAFCSIGCGSNTPYSVIERTEGTGQKTVFVEAPVGATQAEMENWSKEIEAREKPADKTIMINFYNGGRGAKNMIGSYQGGTLYETRIKK